MLIYCWSLDWKYDFDSPDLPSGLKDIACPTPAGPTASKMRGASHHGVSILIFIPSTVTVHGLMNACECADECDCGSCEHPEETLLGTMPKANLGLVVLAQAAAIVESGGPLPPKQGKPQTNKPKKRTRERSASPAIPQIQPKRNKSLPEPIAASKSSCCASRRATSSEVPVLPALLLHPTPVASIPAPKISLPVIDVPSRPSPYKHATTGGCCCGWQCSCPGCTEHRGHDHADAAHANCASADCPTCVDNESGLGIHDPLPVLTFATVPAPSTAVMDALFSHRPYL
jgi:hypothetical protein